MIRIPTTASKLKVGHAYMHRNQHTTRTITRIDRQRKVHYIAFGRYEPENAVFYPETGICSKAHFAKTCPNEIVVTPREVIDSMRMTKEQWWEIITK